MDLNRVQQLLVLFEWWNEHLIYDEEYEFLMKSDEGLRDVVEHWREHLPEVRAQLKRWLREIDECDVKM